MINWLADDGDRHVGIYASPDNRNTCFSFVFRVNVVCTSASNFLRNYVLCVDWGVKPYTLSHSVCVFMCSMAAEKYWGFDKAVTKKYGCKDMAYDPT